ncbi:MAG: hypothetical protein KatS3mg057_0833 [Herpetosiphonaceae bacterium]|nr:MAG: hypothetical protein KatS3mg057_0833 [Herpetosiphonaceae bacterium]
MRKQILLLLALLLGLLAGCGQEQITADEIVRRVQETIESTNDLHTVVDLSMQSPDQSGSGTVEFWASRAGTDAEGNQIVKLRLEVLEASQAKARGVTIVSDGEQAWAFVPSENKVYTGMLDELEELHGTQDSVPMDPLAATDQLREIVQRGLDSFNVELLGEEQVAGHQAYKVRLTPKQEAQQQFRIEQMLTVTAWIDSSRWLPLKVVAEAGSLGKAEATARTLETNTGIADDRFTFTPPAGAEVINVVELIKKSQPRSVSLEEAQQAVDFPLLEPAQLPAGVKLIDVKLVNTSQGSPLVAQIYAGDGLEFSLVQSRGAMTGQDDHEMPGLRHAQAREVSVRGVQGRIVESQGQRAMTFLTWEENDIHLAVAGRISGDQALEIAESLK